MPASRSSGTVTSVLLTSPNSPVPDARARAMAWRAASMMAGAVGSGWSRRSAMSAMTQSLKLVLGGTRPCRYESSRCVCALTSAGRMATLPSGATSVGTRSPTAVIRPPSSVTKPLRIGGAEIGSTHAAVKVVTLLRQAQRSCGSTSRRIVLQLFRHRRITLCARRGQRHHARHLAFAVDRVAENLVVHVAALRGEPGILDVLDDLDLVHAVARSRGTDDVLLDHHAAHVVGAKRQTE